MPRYDYDLIVIGCGVSGFTAATLAAGLGKRVLVVEKESSAKNAALQSGLPSKSLMCAASAADTIRNAGKYGLDYASPEISADGVMPKVRSIVAGMTAFSRSGKLLQLGVDYVTGQAVFVDRHNIRISDKTVSASRFIIATGTRPAKPEALKTSDVPYLTNESLFRLEKLPRSIIVIGGGPTGIEIALALRLLGLEVTVVDAAETILSSEDREMAAHISDYLIGKGIVIYTGHKIAGLDRVGSRARLSMIGESGLMAIEAEEVLVTAGREANIDGLALEKAGVDYNRHAIIVNKHLKTSASNIHACGDVTGCMNLVGVAEHQGLVAANNALLPLKQKVSFEDVVWMVFTEPPLAHVGQTEEQVREDYGFAYKVYKQDYKTIGRAQLEQESGGFAKFLCDQNGRLLGAHIFGPGAEAAAHELQLLKALGKPLARLHSIKHIFPTYGESIVKRMGDIMFLEKMESNPLNRFALRILPGFRNNIEAVKSQLQDG